MQSSLTRTKGQMKRNRRIKVKPFQAYQFRLAGFPAPAEVRQSKFDPAAWLASVIAHAEAREKATPNPQ